MVDLKEAFYSTYRVPRVILELCGCFPNTNGGYKDRNFLFINFFLLYIIFVTGTDVWMSRRNIISMAISMEMFLAAIPSFVKFYNYTVSI